MSTILPWLLFTLTAFLLYCALAGVDHQTKRANKAEGALVEEKRNHAKTSVLLLTVKSTAFHDGVQFAMRRRAGRVPDVEVVSETPIHDNVAVLTFRRQLDNLDEGWQG